MAKKIYVGINSTARKIKRIYAGVNSTARKIKKGYAGVGGVARPVFSAGEIVYYGNSKDGALEPLTKGRYALAAAANEKYAFFGFGNMASGQSDIVDVYGGDLTHQSITQLNAGRRSPAATSIGEYVLFAGGYRSGVTNTVNTYDQNLEHNISTLRATSENLAGSSNGAYALFGGGTNSIGYTITAFNPTLVRLSADNLPVQRGYLAAAGIKNKNVLFGGGKSGSSCCSNVDAYSMNLVHQTLDPLSEARYELSASTVGAYYIFAGGRNNAGVSATVEAYDEDLIKHSLPSLSLGRRCLAATTLGEYALFAGGYLTTFTDTAPSATVDVYDSCLVQKTYSLNEGVASFAGTTIGNYALFGGGDKVTASSMGASTVSTTVNAFLFN